MIISSKSLRKPVYSLSIACIVSLLLTLNSRATATYTPAQDTSPPAKDTVTTTGG